MFSAFPLDLAFLPSVLNIKLIREVSRSILSTGDNSNVLDEGAVTIDVSPDSGLEGVLDDVREIGMLKQDGGVRRATL
ncbi:hypothetical protein EW146_g8292 [Bondarzewia mesenterica]|uniref:Uncharacterized protein n=1 Tax=Bondarzewia mesenterica TaxID=1095465 RepID=A0A4S4LFJ3_9AGAM|nr:hypothetical protein EW146_g8292 [Bondarzewia mesenterica]